MALKDRRDEILQYVRKERGFLSENAQKLDIYRGNLEKHLLKDLKAVLSSNYFDKIQNRVMPINILTKMIDKMSKAYSEPPIREDEGNSEQNNELITHYEETLGFNKKMNHADRYSNLFKAYALEPFVDNGKPKLRVLPYDKYLVMSSNIVDPTVPTVFIKIMGRRPIAVPDRRSRGGTRMEMREVFFTYTDNEFDAFDDSGDTFEAALEDNDGINKFGRIPIYYGNRSDDELIPTQDSDVLRLSKVFPIILSDMSGAIMFQCFTVIWGIDVKFEDVTMSPNSIWELKSDASTDKAPQVGTLKPEVDSDKVLAFVLETFAFWLETKGIKAGSVGEIQGGRASSGIAKVLDEMDTTDIRKVSIECFKQEEKEFWDLLAHMHNIWVSSGEIEAQPIFTEDFSLTIEYDDPKPDVDRDKEVKTVDFEVKNGYELPINGLKRLYPDDTDDQIKERLEYYTEINTVVIEEADGMDERENIDSEGVQPTGAKGDSPRDN